MNQQSLTMNDRTKEALRELLSNFPLEERDFLHEKAMSDLAIIDRDGSVFILHLLWLLQSMNERLETIEARLAIQAKRSMT